MLRHWADVVADATRALKISPKNVDALVSRGRAYQATGQEKKAKVDAQAAAASDSSNEAAKALLESFEPKKAVAGLGGMSLDKPSKGFQEGLRGHRRGRRGAQEASRADPRRQARS
jgi:hypothetical protein